MDNMQELEWLEAQKIGISKDLVAAAKQQLEFLAAVDRRRFLYDGPILRRAINRYKNFWLPLLAKHNESGVLEGSLVVPLDCEWIWHCHRLNPVQYKKDCEKFYGRMLDNQYVESSLHAKSKHQSIEMWAKLYPGEPFELDCSRTFSDAICEAYSGAEESITYDLVSAVNRQCSFYYQVARPSMHENRFLEGAVARYKGFLHLIKRNQERSIKRFCVPTYDIDLIWHSHQLQPVSYCKDMLKLLGKILEHDDTDADRTKGLKLDVGFSETTKQWEDAYGLRYWRAGAMYRGSLPSPLDVDPYLSDSILKNEVILEKSQKLMSLQKTMVMEVLLEIVGVKDLPAGQIGNLFVSFSKKCPDMFFSGSCTLSILSESEEKQVAGFQCEPTGELVLALMTNSNPQMPRSGPAKTIGVTSIPLQDLMDQNSKLSVEKWFELKPHSGALDSKPISLLVAASFTVPVPAPQVLHMFKSHHISLNACFFPLSGKVQQIRRWTRVVDVNGNDVISLQMRTEKEKEGRNTGISKRYVVGVTRKSRKPHLLAEYAENTWSLNGYNFSICVEKDTNQGALSFELVCDKQIKLFPGRRLEYEPKNCNHIEVDFITAVEFSPDHPYGRAVALLDTKSSLTKVIDEWFVLPAILLLFILKKEGRTGENVKPITRPELKTSMPSKALAVEAVATQAGTTVKGGGCSGGCGSGCGNALKRSGIGAGGCGSGCGGKCGNLITDGSSGGCGGCGGGNLVTNGGSGGNGGCGGGCGNMAVNGGSGGCGAGCGGCGSGGENTMKSSGCGGCGAGCGGGCGSGENIMKSSGCGGCGAGCGGGCGSGENTMKNSGCGGCGSGCGGGGCGGGYVNRMTVCESS